MYAAELVQFVVNLVVDERFVIVRGVVAYDVIDYKDTIHTDIVLSLSQLLYTTAVCVERCCTSGSRFATTRSRYCGTDRLTVTARIEFKLCTLVHQSITGTAPTYINDMLQPVSDLDRQMPLRSACKGDLVIPCARLKFGERAFSRRSAALE